MLSVPWHSATGLVCHKNNITVHLPPVPCASSHLTCTHTPFCKRPFSIDILFFVKKAYRKKVFLCHSSFYFHLLLSPPPTIPLFCLHHRLCLPDPLSHSASLVLHTTACGPETHPPPPHPPAQTKTTTTSFPPKAHLPETFPSNFLPSSPIFHSHTSLLLHKAPAVLFFLPATPGRRKQTTTTTTTTYHLGKKSSRRRLR